MAEEVEWKTKGGTQFEEEGDDLNLEQLRQGREEKMNHMVKTLGMFESGSSEEATPKAGIEPTTMKWFDRVKKDDDGREFVSCRLVARDFKPRREGPRNDLLRCHHWRQRRIREVWEVCQAEELVVCNERQPSDGRDDYARRLVNDWVLGRKSRTLVLFSATGVELSMAPSTEEENRQLVLQISSVLVTSGTTSKHLRPILHLRRVCMARAKAIPSCSCKEHVVVSTVAQHVGASGSP